MIFGAAEGQAAFEVVGSALVNQPGHLCGADKRYGIDARVIANRIDNIAFAIDDIKYSVGQPGLFEQEGQTAGAEGYLFRWFEDHAIAEDQGIGDGPVGDHGREVEGNNGCYHSYGRTFGPAFYTPADFQYFARYQLGHGSGKLGEFDGFLYFSSGLIAGLTVFFADKGDQLFFVLFQQVFIPEEDLCPFFYRGAAPAAKGRPG